MLKEQDIIKGDLTESVYTVQSELAVGGQATVYLITSEKEKYVAKLYHEHTPTSVLTNVKGLIKQPVDDELLKFFAWPIETFKIQNRFGYIMRYVKAENYHTIDKIQNSTDVYPDIKVFYTWCKNISKCFASLHRKGYVYRDINATNIELSLNGDVMFYDNDNIASKNSDSLLIYTTPYTAPEILSGEKRVQDKYTDTYSLAILLFKILCYHQPFHGKAYYDIINKNKYVSEDMIMDIYKYPVFVFSDIDDSNKLVESYDGLVKIFYEKLPKEVKDLFLRTFILGVTEREERCEASEFEEVMEKVIKELKKCSCKQEYYHPETSSSNKCIDCELLEQM